MSGRFVAFEGGEASGKSTQARRLAERWGAVVTFEPGATPLGARVRELLLDPASAVSPRAEALLMLADRAQHVEAVIRPALAAGRDVVCDRFSGSTLAYQGYGRGLPVDELRHLCDWAAGGLHPDLVVLLDVPGDVARRRLGGALDRFEAAADEFHHRIAAGYRSLAAEDTRWVVVDGQGAVDEVGARVQEAVEAALGIRVADEEASG